MAHDELVTLFERRRDAWVQHDIDALVEGYTEDAVLVSPYVGHVAGPAAIGHAHQSFLSAFPDLVYQQEALLIEGDTVALFVSIKGTHVGEFMGMSPTGRRFECHLASLMTMRGARICHERRIYDFSGLLIQIGVLKAKPV